MNRMSLLLCSGVEQDRSCLDDESGAPESTNPRSLPSKCAALMKILLRPRLFGQALAARIAADPQLAGPLGAQPNAAVGFLFKKFFDARGPLLARVLAHARAEGEAASFLRDLQFAPAEIAGASHLEVVCRKTAGQSDAETRATLEDYRAAALRATASRWPVRLPQRVFLGQPVPEDTIAHVDQYTGEYVLGTAAAQALRASGLTGWRLAPVLHWKTREPLAGLAEHVTTEALLPAALTGAGVYETADDGPGRPTTPRRRGALTYAAGALDASPDFARTAEPWCDWATPQWIVRQRVRAWYEGHSLRGWAFWPVLVEGTALHREHEQRWTDLLAQLREAGAELA
jgi:hypothetical protein